MSDKIPEIKAIVEGIPEDWIDNNFVKPTIDIPIGEKVIINNKVCICKEQEWEASGLSCHYCGAKHSIACRLLDCCGFSRDDEKNVIYEEVKEDE